VARNILSKQLQTRSARLALPKSDRPYFVQIAKGLSLGYRRIDGPKAPWLVRSTIARVDRWSARLSCIPSALRNRRASRKIILRSLASSIGPMSALLPKASVKASYP
jgi:hypothetical protein